MGYTLNYEGDDTSGLSAAIVAIVTRAGKPYVAKIVHEPKDGPSVEADYWVHGVSGASDDHVEVTPFVEGQTNLGEEPQERIDVATIAEITYY